MKPKDPKSKRLVRAWETVFETNAYPDAEYRVDILKDGDFKTIKLMRKKKLPCEIHFTAPRGKK